MKSFKKILLLLNIFKEGSPSAVSSFQGALHLNTILINLRIKLYSKHMYKNLKIHFIYDN